MSRYDGYRMCPRGAHLQKDQLRALLVLGVNLNKETCFILENLKGRLDLKVRECFAPQPAASGGFPKLSLGADDVRVLDRAGQQ